MLCNQMSIHVSPTSALTVFLRSGEETTYISDEVITNASKNLSETSDCNSLTNNGIGNSDVYVKMLLSSYR